MGFPVGTESKSAKLFWHNVADSRTRRRHEETFQMTEKQDREKDLERLLLTLIDEDELDGRQEEWAAEIVKNIERYCSALDVWESKGEAYQQLCGCWDEAKDPRQPEDEEERKKLPGPVDQVKYQLAGQLGYWIDSGLSVDEALPYVERDVVRAPRIKSFIEKGVSAEQAAKEAGAERWRWKAEELVGAPGADREESIERISRALRYACDLGYTDAIAEAIVAVTSLDVDAQPEGERQMGYLKALEDVSNILDVMLE